MLFLPQEQCPKLIWPLIINRYQFSSSNISLHPILTLLEYFHKYIYFQALMWSTSTLNNCSHKYIVLMYYCQYICTNYIKLFNIVLCFLGFQITLSIYIIYTGNIKIFVHNKWSLDYDNMLVIIIFIKLSIDIYHKYILYDYRISNLIV